MNLVNYGRNGSLDRAVGAMFKGFFDDFDNRPQNGWTPRMEVLERDDSYAVRLELPGVEEKDVNVTLEDSILTVTGDKVTENEETRGDCHFSERSFGSFSRRVRLPKNADAANVTAVLKNGVLQVTVGKAEESQPRSIPVSSE